MRLGQPHMWVGRQDVKEFKNSMGGARMNRRTFLSTAAWAAASSAANAASSQPIQLGVDTYSIRGFHWKAHQLVDYASKLKLDAVQISSSGFESLDDAYLAGVKEYGARHGVFVEPGMGCIGPLARNWNPKRQGDPTKYLLEVVRVAKALGSPSVKVYMGNTADRAGSTPIEAHIEATVKALRTVRSQALDAGVKIGVENHGDMTARETRTLIEEAGKDFVGCCLDAGNAVRLLDDPLLALEILGPYTVTTHIRDSVLYEHPRGAAMQWVAVGDGTIDFPAFVERYRELCPKAPFQLEIITGSPAQVLPYLEPDFWSAFPDTLAADFARFVALAKKGRPFMGSMMIGGRGKQPPEYEAALKEQQRVDLERSLEYCKKSLGIGIRWRG